MYSVEHDRLQTFGKWTKVEISIYELAKFGWYYTGFLDLVKCAFCRAEKLNWMIGDHPLTIHIQISPGCPLLIRKSQNRPLQKDFNELLPPPSSIVKLPNGKEIIKLIDTYIVLHPDFRSYNSRLLSYNEWPKAMRPTPHELSDAGFFYLGKSDQVKCFYCSGLIENWDSDWDAWEQHVHRFEKCQYVQLCKSPEFIEYVRAKFSGESHLTKNNNIEEVRTRHNTTNNSEQKFRKLCNKCHTIELNSIFIPCMHIYTCINCGSQEKNCPVCQQEISEIKKCFIYI